MKSVKNYLPELMVGFLIGNLLGALVGRALYEEIPAELRYPYVRLFSALVMGLVALGLRIRILRARKVGELRYISWAGTITVVAATVFLVLYASFVRRCPAGAGTTMFLTSPWRGPSCDFNARSCEEILGFGIEKAKDCWRFVGLVRVGLFLSYLLTLVGVGAIVGLLRQPSEEPTTRPDDYLDFHVRVATGKRGDFHVEVRDQAGRSKSARFSLPEALRSVEDFVVALEGEPRSARGVEERAALDPELFGGELFEAVFRDDVRSVLRTAREEARRDKRGLRIRLDLQNAPDLAVLPWEYLYDDKGPEGFFAQSRNTPLVRDIEQIQPYQPLSVEPPLRVLVAVAQPPDLPALDVEREWIHIREALRPLEREGLVVVERLPLGTLEALHQRLQRDEAAEQAHVFHFIGHGGLIDGKREGALAFVGAVDRPDYVSGETLGKMLNDHGTKLAVLNACHGATMPQGKPLAGVAQTLLARGLPAVVAMQTAVSDETARLFAGKFYEALAFGYPVDAALSEVRKLLSGLRDHKAEWGTPVLYLHAPSGRIFDVEGGHPNEWLKRLEKGAPSSWRKPWRLLRPPPG